MLPTINSKGRNSAIQLDPANKPKEDIFKFQQDLNIIVNKIAELNGELIPARFSEIGIGNGGSAESQRKQKDSKESKLMVLENILQKICEYDRLILRKTAPTELVPQRRKSIGIDLFSIPTHFHIVDRLLDLHTQSKRVTVIKTTSVESSTTSSKNDNNVSETLLVNKSAALLDKSIDENNKVENEKLKKIIEVFKKKEKISEQDNKDLKIEIKKLKIDFEKNVFEINKIKDEKRSETEKSNLEFKKKNDEMEKKLADAYLKLEIETSRYHDILNTILGKASRINSSKDFHPVFNDCNHLVFFFFFYVCFNRVNLFYFSFDYYRYYHFIL
jgi:hypothetical protein